MLQKYNETSPKDEKRFKGATHAMKVGAKEKTVKLYVKMIKLLIVANLARHGFFEEVKFHILKIIL